MRTGCFGMLMLIVVWLTLVAGCVLAKDQLVAGPGSPRATAANTRAGAGSGDGAGDGGAKGTGIAVVELFTSEGCSSCPPADALLAQLIQRSKKDGRAVYALAFHVDYWDRLGWVDPFASAAATARQRAYAAAMAADSVYTPQMIVNGDTGFVGSDAKAASAAIEHALATPATAELTVTLRAAGEGRYLLEYKVNDAADERVLNIAVVERGLSSDVPRGENAGKTLTHENVVRSFKTVALKDAPTGAVPLTPPVGVKLANASVIVYIQQAGHRSISAAVEVAEWPKK